MGKPSIPQIRLGGSQYTIEPTADAEERIPYPYKELPIAMFKQMYRPLLGDQIPIHWHEGMQLYGSMKAPSPIAPTERNFLWTATNSFSSTMASCIVPVLSAQRSGPCALTLEKNFFLPPFGSASWSPLWKIRIVLMNCSPLMRQKWKT